MHASDEDLALIALGERLPGVDAHVRACPTCAPELRALASTVDTARRAHLAALPPPPDAVWDRISSELGLVGPPAVVVPLEAGRVRRTPWRRPLLAGAGTLTAAAAAALVVVAVVGEDPAAPSSEQARVPLTALGAVDARGEVVLTDSADTRSLTVDTRGLPDADGFYEVWLVDLDAGRLVALGTLDEAGRGRLTVPDGVDLSDYPEVDISLEPHDGDPGHSGDSVLRGPLPA